MTPDSLPYSEPTLDELAALVRQTRAIYQRERAAVAQLGEVD